MFSSVLAAGFTALLVLTGSAQSAEGVSQTSLDLEPAINGAVSANGLFPNQPMEEEFASYLDWTKETGQSRLVAFESSIDDAAPASGALPTERMDDQFAAYMNWVDDQGLSPIYAFLVTDFD